MSSKPQRKKVWIDKQLQGVVIRRVLVYWCTCFAFLTIPILFARTLADPTMFFFQHLPSVMVEFWPMYAGLMLLLPVVLYDALIISHRVAGPLFRIREQIESLASGSAASDVQLREKDFMQDLVEPLNELRIILHREKTLASNPSEQKSMS